MFKYIAIGISLIAAIPQTSFAQSAIFSNLINIDRNSSCHPQNGRTFGIKQAGSYVAQFELYRGSQRVETTPNIHLGQCWNVKPTMRQQRLTVKGLSLIHISEPTRPY